MPKIKEIRVNSKRTLQIKTEYVSFEASMIADVEDLDDKTQVDSYMNELFAKCNNQIDNQAEDFVKATLQ